MAKAGDGVGRGVAMGDGESCIPRPVFWMRKSQLPPRTGPAIEAVCLRYEVYIPVRNEMTPVRPHKVRAQNTPSMPTMPRFSHGKPQRRTGHHEPPRPSRTVRFAGRNTNLTKVCVVQAHAKG